MKQFTYISPIENTLELFQDLPVRRSSIDVGFATQPNHSDIIITKILAPQNLTAIVTVLPFFDTGKLILAYSQKRKRFEFPGGKIELGESMETAAKREVFEETGCKIDRLVPIAVIRTVSEGEKPKHGKFPFPVCFHQFYAGRIDSTVKFTPTKECGMPDIITAKDLLQSVRLIPSKHKVIYEAALNDMYNPAVMPRSLRDLIARPEANKSLLTLANPISP